MSAAERGKLDEDGFVVRQGVFSPDECADIAGACEDLIASLEAGRRHTKRRVGSYMFEIAREAGAVVKWEPFAPDVVQALEAFVHLSPTLKACALDPRLVDPCKAIVGEDELALFTEKLNVKRARDGGQYILHQDFPYWEPMSPIAAQVATAMVFLDDAMRENGCLEVAPGSHKVGKWPLRTDAEEFAREMDISAFDMSRLRALEVQAGTVVFFGAFLVHRSLPNRSDRDRRALLYSYQPAGHPHLFELFGVVPKQAPEPPAG